MIPLNILTISIITRMLGPGLFGDFKYLIYVFTILSGLIGFGNDYFITELSKNHHDKTLISFYWLIMLQAWVVATSIVIVAINSDLLVVIFPGQDTIYILLAYFLAFFTFISSLLDSMTDACGVTKKATIFNFFAKIFGLIMIVTFVFIFNWENLYSAFAYSYVVVFVLIAGFFYVLKTNGYSTLHFRISLYDFKQKFSSYYNYSHPLFVLSIVGISLGFAGRWMLQKFGGSIEQGYFSLSDSFSAFIIIFSNSIAPLLMREFSISYKEKDINEIKLLFNKSLLFFTTFSAYLCVFSALNASAITLLIGGKSFEGAILPTTIMLFYPIPYIANNILSPLIYATGRTVLMRNVSILVSVLGVITTFILIAPNKYLGLDLGAVGFSISMLTITIFHHLVLLKYTLPSLNIKWTKVTGNYIKIILTFLVIGAIWTSLCKVLIHDLWVSFMLSGLLYSLCTFLFIKRFPGMIGLSATELNTTVNSLIKKFKIN